MLHIIIYTTPFEDMTSAWLLSTENEMIRKLVNLDILAPSPETLICNLLCGSVMSNTFCAICKKKSKTILQVSKTKYYVHKVKTSCINYHNHRNPFKVKRPPPTNCMAGMVSHENILLYTVHQVKV